MNRSDHESGSFFDLLDLTKLGKPEDGEEIPEPGEPGNEWIGAEVMVNGQKQFQAASGAQRNRWRRLGERLEAARQRAGQRRFNRAQRLGALTADTRRQQLAILKGEIEVTPAMRENLERAVKAEHGRNEAQLTAVERGTQAAVRRERALELRRIDRFKAGKPRGADLRDDVFHGYSQHLPADYAGKRANER